MGSANVLKVLLEIKINVNLAAKTASHVMKSHALSVRRLSNSKMINAPVRQIPFLALIPA